MGLTALLMFSFYVTMSSGGWTPVASVKMRKKNLRAANFYEIGST